MLQMEYRHKIEFSMPEIETFLAKFKITCTNTLWIFLYLYKRKKKYFVFINPHVCKAFSLYKVHKTKHKSFGNFCYII